MNEAIFREFFERLLFKACKNQKERDFLRRFQGELLRMWTSDQMQEKRRVQAPEADL